MSLYYISLFKEVRKELARINKEKADLGLELIPNARHSKNTIVKKLEDELKPAMQEERMNVSGKCRICVDELFNEHA